MSEQPDEKHARYLEERKILIQTEVSVAQKLDSSLLTLAGGALGLSIAFLRDIAPEPPTGSMVWVVGAWILFLVVIAVTVSGLWTSIEAHRKARDILDEEYEADGEVDERNPWERATFWLSLVGLVAFILGASSLATFAALNVN